VGVEAAGNLPWVSRLIATFITLRTFQRRSDARSHLFAIGELRFPFPPDTA
jgi:hypothetical protein